MLQGSTEGRIAAGLGRRGPDIQAEQREERASLGIGRADFRNGTHDRGGQHAQRQGRRPVEHHANGTHRRSRGVQLRASCVIHGIQQRAARMRRLRQGREQQSQQAETRQACGTGRIGVPYQAVTQLRCRNSAETRALLPDQPQIVTPALALMLKARRTRGHGGHGPRPGC